MARLKYPKASRAYYIATILRDNDFRVFWDRNNPKFIETSASHEETVDLENNFPGGIANWKDSETIDVEAMR